MSVERELSIWPRVAESITQPIAGGIVRAGRRANLRDRRQNAVKLDLLRLCRFRPLLFLLLAQKSSLFSPIVGG